MKYQTTSAAETKKIASSLAKKIKSGGIVALIGNLGAGKTTFSQGFAKGLGIKENLISPTFILMREYHLGGGSGRHLGKLYHIDLYRLEDPKQMENIGLEEIFDNPKNIVLIEWAEKLPHLPKNVTTVNIKNLGKNLRGIEIS